MKPEIRGYLEEHGDTYTTEALRQGLVEAGHSPAEVDEALQEWRDELGRPPAHGVDRRRLNAWSAGFHVAAFVLLVLLILVTGGGGIYLAIGIGILALFLLLGWMISVSIGRWLLPGSGLAVALIAPAASALVIGGTCMAIVGGFN
jgi:hypothetical protein